MKKGNRIITVTLFITLLVELLKPYIINYDSGFIKDVIYLLSFFSLPLISYSLGTIAESKKNLWLLLIYVIVTNALYNIIIATGDFLNLWLTTKILFCFVIWSKVIKYFDKLYYIPILFAISLLTGFYTEINDQLALSYLINLFPFFVMGYYIKFNIKINNIIKKIIAVIIAVITIAVTVFIIKRFFVSLDILLLKPYVTKKHLIFRMGYFSLSILLISSLYLFFNNRDDILSKIGNNSILIIALFPIIYIPFTIINDMHIYNNLYLLYAFLSILLLYIFSSVIFKFISRISFSVRHKKIVTVLTLILLIVSLSITNFKVNYIEYPIYEQMTKEEIEDIKDAYSISFVGDLILLENQVKAGYKNGIYNYDKMFQYTNNYFDNSNLSIGILEGPVANSSYTIGNFDDDVSLYLNFPKEFIESIKNSGIDLVSTSNNHIMDKGLDGVYDTINNLNKINLDYVGMYKSENPQRYRIIYKDDMKIGVLAYTYGSNYYTEDEMIDYNITPIIVSPGSKNFNRIKKQVKKDFDELKKENVDLIIVIPHMGTQFSHDTDVFQNTWNKIFVENGANIVFGDHSHAVQPIEYINDSVIINCPGNFANQYTKFDGDATAITKVYINKNNKKIIASSIVPMYTRGDNNGFFYNIPIYDIMNNEEITSEISNNELKHIKEIHDVITTTMLGIKLDIDNIEEEYFLFKNGYKRNKVKPMDISNIEGNEFLKLLNSAENVCFIGDSVTQGTKNGGYGWFEPIMANYNIDVKTAAFGSHTTYMLLKDKKQSIINCKSALNIIAIGTNDIRYNNPDISAMNKEQYINNINSIIELLKENNFNAKFVLIAPWYSTPSDTISKLKHNEKMDKIREYSEALYDYSITNNYMFIDPNAYIEEKLNTTNSNYYLKDFIHPNMTKGIYLYSKAVLNGNNTASLSSSVIY